MVFGTQIRRKTPGRHLRNYPRDLRKIQDFILKNFAIQGSKSQALQSLATRMEEHDIIVGAKTHFERASDRYLDPAEFLGFALADKGVPFCFVNLNAQNPFQVLVRNLILLISNKSEAFNDGIHPDEMTLEIEKRLMEPLSGEKITKNKKLPSLSPRFIRALGTSLQKGDTYHHDAHYLLGITRRGDLERLMLKHGIKV